MWSVFFRNRGQTILEEKCDKVLGFPGNAGEFGKSDVLAKLVATLV